MARDGFRPSRLRSGMVARASKNAVFPYGVTVASAFVIDAALSVKGTISRASDSAKTQSEKSSPG